MESGSLVNSSLSRSEGLGVGCAGRSYQISPMGTPSWAALLQGVKSTTPHGLGKACTCASSIAMMLHLWCTVEKSGIVTPMV